MDNLQFKFVRLIDPVIGSALISAGGSMLSNVFGGILGNDSAKKQFNMQRQLIREQNEYNKPVNQLARFQQAGISPVYALGGGSLTAGNQDQQGQAPDVSSARQGATKNLQDAMKAGMDTYLQAKSTEQQIQESKSREGVNNQLANLYGTQNTGQEITNRILSFESSKEWLDLRKQGLSNEVALNWAKIGLSNSETFKCINDVYATAARLNIDKAHLQNETTNTIMGVLSTLKGLEKSDAEIVLARVQANTSRKLGNLYDEERKTEKKKQGLLDEQKKTEQEKQKEIQANTAKTNVDTAVDYIDGLIKQYEYNVLASVPEEDRATIGLASQLMDLVFTPIKYAFSAGASFLGGFLGGGAGSNSSVPSAPGIGFNTGYSGSYGPIPGR